MDTELTSLRNPDGTWHAEDMGTGWNRGISTVPDELTLKPLACRLAPPERSPAHDFAPLPDDVIWTLYCRQCGERA